NMNAPWLFTDIFCLTYVNHMTRAGMVAYSGFLATSYREDICEYFLKGLNETGDLYKQTLNIAINKGVNARHPYIEIPKETDYIDSKKYNKGINPFSSKRPLNAVEISHLYLYTISHAIRIEVCLSFALISPDNIVLDYLTREKEISQMLNNIFMDTLAKNDIEIPHLPDVAISYYTTKTFSYKLIMFLMSQVLPS